MGVQTLEVFSVWWQKLLKRMETYKYVKISILHCDVKKRHVAAPHMIDLMFLNWHNCINNENI